MKNEYNALLKNCKKKKNIFVAVFGIPFLVTVSVLFCAGLGTFVNHFFKFTLFYKTYPTSFIDIIFSGITTTIFEMIIISFIFGLIIALIENISKLPTLLNSRYLPLTAEELSQFHFESDLQFLDFTHDLCSFEPKMFKKLYAEGDRIYVKRLRYDIYKMIRVYYRYIEEIGSEDFDIKITEKINSYSFDFAKYLRNYLEEDY